MLSPARTIQTGTKLATRSTAREVWYRWVTSKSLESKCGEVSSALAEPRRLEATIPGMPKKQRESA